MLKRFSLVLLFLFIVSLTLPSGLSQSFNGPQPPPVDIEATSSTTDEGQTILSLSIIPSEDMHVEISLLIPKGLKVAGQYQHKLTKPRNPYSSVPDDRNLIPLSLGLIKANNNKAFEIIFLTPSQPYDLVAKVQAMAKWGIKEQVIKIGGQS